MSSFMPEAEAPKTQTFNRSIRKVAVLGSGVMGSRIALHFANIGCQVELLDIVPFKLTEDEVKKGLTLDSPSLRNKLVDTAFQAAIKSSPSPTYDISFAKRVRTGNFEDHLSRIADADLIVEAVIENLDIKKGLYEKIEIHRKKGSIMTSNTSGIPMKWLTEGRSEDFKKHFCGMHFFNPPRYLRLLEIIPAPETDPKIVDFLMHYGDLYLGKETVLCKDTPAFIANRIGIFGIMSGLHTVEKMGLTVAEVDKLTGPVIGRPKSATFRTLDVVGLDTAIKVANGLYAACPEDEAREAFQLPEIVRTLETNKWFGDKTSQGYYKKTKNAQGKTEILELNLKTYEYASSEKVKFEVLERTKEIDVLAQRFPVLMADTGKAGAFYRESFYQLFSYCSFRIPEISDELFRLDQAVCAGFGWEMGPFATWDALGVRSTVEKMMAEGKTVAAWVHEMLSKGKESFFKVINGISHYYDIPSGNYKAIPGKEGFIILNNLRETKKVWGNSGSTIFDLGDGILGLEFHTKMNSLGAEVIEGINQAVTLGEKSFRGLVIGNEGPNFSAGANLAMLLMFAFEQEYDEIQLMVSQFQKTMMRLRYSSIPVVGAPSGMALGGGCELLLHTDHIQAHTESYIGLVEVGVGLIPAGGGTKEMTLRASDSYKSGDPEMNRLQEYFVNIATAKVSTSAYEAKNMGIIRSTDAFTLNRSRLITDAKEAAIRLAEDGYTQPIRRKDIKVLGRSAYAAFKAAVVGMHFGQYASEHDLKIASKIANVMCGGDLSAPALVSEDYLLELEREAFVSLTAEKKTLERIQSILTTGKPLRN